MYRVRFDYKRTCFGAMPIVPLMLHGPSASWPTEALLDSGATYSLFDECFAAMLGLDLSAGRKETFRGLGGAAVECVMMKVSLTIGHRRFEADVGFAGKLGIGLNILGRTGVFDNFESVVFLERKKQVLLM